MAADEKDLLGVINEIDARFKEFDSLHETCERMKREGEEAKRLMALQESVDSDLEEGSVESLLRAKEKVNLLLDGMIKRALDAAV
jgi:hypothetical protein